MAASTAAMPSDEGEYSPREAEAMLADQLGPNLAKSEKIAELARTTVQSIIPEWTERMRPLHKRWRGSWWMLSSNTLEKGGLEDVHVPELYKHVETIVPRIEEVIVERDPFFRVVARQSKDEALAEANAAYFDWQFSQANVRSKIQPAIRDMLVTQCAAMHCYWDNHESERTIREITKEFNEKGLLVRKVKKHKAKVIDFAGPKVDLIDPLDFIIDSNATNPQDAVYVGHRAWLTIDEIRRLGKEFGWVNVDSIENEVPGSYAQETDRYKWARNPTAAFGDAMNRIAPNDGRPKKLEVIFLYCKWTMNDGASYEDYRFVSVSGKAILEVRRNPNDGDLRPYATMNTARSGHEFYSTGPLDNAVRLNQHLDLIHQIVMHSAKTGAGPFVFAEDDSDLPDTLYRSRPWQVFKGTGPIKFSQMPDGVLRSAPMLFGEWKNNIAETIGSYPIQMGQDSNGTATEASLSLQEGNRRQRGLLRAVADGLDQLLHLFHRYSVQYSSADIEFPVLGKRALSMRKTHLNFSPSDLLDDVKFELIGLRSARTYGLKATGLQAAINSTQVFIANNPRDVDQVKIIHDVFSELVGPDAADDYVKMPTPITMLYSQEEENEGLLQGAEIEVDDDDDHEQHLKDLDDLYRLAVQKDSPLPMSVQQVIILHRETHRMKLKRKQATEKIRQERQPQQGPELPPPEMGGPEQSQDAPPPRGGMSNAMEDWSTGPDGQAPGQNPGPADSRKYGRSGRSSRTTNQTEDRQA